MSVLRPTTAEEVLDLMGTAVAEARPLEITGSGAHRDLGRPVSVGDRGGTGLDLSGLAGVVDYAPDELFLTARPSTPMREIRALLQQYGQVLAFEPIDHSALLGGDPGAGTIGGAVAMNLSGPRRIKAGAARDHVLGFRAVSGRAEIFKSGGQVMKNVTGYDLSKLMTGSWGTLAVLTEVTLKVLPKAPVEKTLLIKGLDDVAAVKILTVATGMAHEGSSFAHLPAGVGAVERTGPMTAIRVEGPETSVDARLTDFQRDLARSSVDVLQPAESEMFWAAVRDARPLADQADTQIWRLSVAPTDGPSVVTAIRAGGVPVSGYYYDWAGGLVWLAVAPVPDAHNATIRAAVDQLGGHATLVRASADVRRRVPVFHPQPAPLTALAARIKDAFDPTRILNPGRMREDL